MKYLIPFLFALLGAFSESSAQDLGAFTDVRGFFYTFDAGYFEQQESQPIRDLKVARNYVAWVNTMNQFKVYEDGYVKVLREIPPTTWGISDNFMVFEINGMLYVYENQRSKRITTFVGEYQFSDSIIAYIDFNQGMNVYYRGLSRNLEVFDVDSLKVGKNVVAYTGPADEFYVYHANENRQLDYLLPQHFKVGMNTVAYVDNYGRFKIYHKGTIVQADPFPPNGFQVGDDMVAWINRNNQLMVFDEGIITLVEDFAPEKYTVKDAILAYELPTREFRAYYRGQTFALESYIPEKYDMDDQTLVWMDFMGQLKGLQRGEPIRPSDRIVQDFDVKLDVVRADVNLNRPQFWWNGKVYQ